MASSNPSNLKPFESTVIFRESGVEHNAVVLAVKGDGVIDLGFFRQLMSADGKTPLRVVGSSRQAEMVEFRHDVLPAQYELVEDWFFGLSDSELQALLSERSLRKLNARIEKSQTDEKARQEQMLAGVKVRPSNQVLNLAEDLWEHAIRESQKLDEHTHVELPDYDGNQEAWKPWIEQAKQKLAAEKSSSQFLTKAVAEKMPADRFVTRDRSNENAARSTQPSGSPMPQGEQSAGTGEPDGEKDPAGGENGPGSIQ